jgi:EAL domain-containing protein (putative c-di-GMP-specific phosphodiesterase class I)
LRRRRANGFVAAPSRCPASAASLLLALSRRRSQCGPRDFCHGLPGLQELRLKNFRDLPISKVKMSHSFSTFRDDPVDSTKWFEKALREDRFETWFQPIIDTAGQSVLAHECLIRFCDERLYEGGEIVDAARLRCEIQAFDAYARRLAIHSAARESQTGLYFINYVPIYDPQQWMRSARDAVSESEMDPENFVFEVIGSDMVRDHARLRRLCDYCRTNEFGFALDDAGAGPSSPQLIRELRPDFIKLDRMLVRDAEDPMWAATIRKLVELGDQFGVRVIAKGVERPRIMENLWLLGVEVMQGYLFGRPSPQIVRCGSDLSNLGRALEPERPRLRELHPAPVPANLD